MIAVSTLSMPRLVGILLLTVAVASARPALTAPVSAVVELRDMTWVEVRSAIQAGSTTVIVPTGGIEQNGPHMALGKHDYIVAEAARRIAGGVGKTLVAPVVSYVPEGDFNPPSGHMRFPGTIGVSEAAFDGVLEGIATSLKLAGFRTIVIIGDHGQSQPVQARVAERLTKAWIRDGVRVVHLAAYYDDGGQIRRLLGAGHSRAAIGDHASLIDTAELMSVKPAAVDLSRHVPPSATAEATGVVGDPTAAKPDLGASLLDMRVKAAIEAIRQLTPVR
jgi:creatinine amidohydrolase